MIPKSKKHRYFNIFWLVFQKMKLYIFLPVLTERWTEGRVESLAKCNLQTISGWNKPTPTQFMYIFVKRYLWLLLCRLLNTYTQMDVSQFSQCLEHPWNNSCWSSRILLVLSNFGPDNIGTREMKMFLINVSILLSLEPIYFNEIANLQR